MPEYQSEFLPDIELKPWLFAHDPDQIFDLVYYPLARQIGGLLLKLVIVSGIPSYIPVKRFKNFPFNFKRDSNNAFFDHEDISFLFQRYNRFGGAFADQYSFYLYNFFDNFKQFQPYHLLSEFPGFSKFDAPSASVFSPNSPIYQKYQSLVFEEVKIKLPENGLKFAINYYVPEYKSDLYPEAPPRQYQFGNNLVYENWDVIYSRLDLPCYKSPKSRNFIIEHLTDFCKGQEIIIKDDILIHSLIIEFFDDEKKDKKWTENERKFILDQIPEYYFYSGINNFFSEIYQWISDQPFVNINFVPKLLTGLNTEIKGAFIVNPYPVRLSNGSYNVGYSFDFREDSLSYDLPPNTIDIPDWFYNRCLIYANNNKWGNYDYENLEDIEGSLILNSRAPIYVEYNNNPQIPPFSYNTNSDAKVYTLIATPDKPFPLFGLIEYEHTYTHGGQPYKIIFDNGIKRTTGQYLSNPNYTFLYPKGHLFNPNELGTLAQNFLTTNREYSFTFLSSFGSYRSLVGAAHIGIASGKETPANNGIDDYYTEISCSIYVFKLEADTQKGGQNVSNISFSEVTSYSGKSKHKSSNLSSQNYINSIASFVCELPSQTFTNSWDYSLNESFFASQNPQDGVILNLINSIETCYTCMPCNCDEINEKLDKLIAALDANKFAFLDNSTNQSRVANIGYYVERIARVLGVSVNSDGSIRSIRQSKEIIEGKEIPAGWTIGQWSRNNGGNSEGQTGGAGEEERDGLAYEIRSNTFDIDPGTGEATKIIQGGYALVENFPQLLHIILEDLDRAIGWQDAGANAIPSADGSKIATYQGLNRMLIDVLYNQSAISRSTTGAQISALKNQAILQEILASFGFPIVVKEIPVQVAEGYEAKLPVPATQGGAPTLNDLFQLILLNLSLLIGSKLKATEEAKDEEGNVNLDEE